MYTLRFVIINSLFLLSWGANAQHFSLSRLFYPNVTLKAEYMPAASFGDNHTYGLSRTSFMGMIPLRSEVEAGIGFRRKLDIRARHTMLLANFSQINPTVDGKEMPSNGFKTLSLSAIMLQASLRDKIWVYGVGGGITESNETFFTPQPFLYGGAARMRVFGLNSQIIYGTALVYNQKFRIIPLFGFNKKLGKNWHASALLPVALNVNYKAKDWINFGTSLAVGGYSGGFQEVTATEKLLRRQNYQHVKLSLSANAHVLTVLNLSLEVGVLSFRQVKTFNTARETLSSFNPGMAPYVSASVRYITSKSKLSSKFMNKLGLGGVF
ncbi:MAG: hypothetical protein U0Y10_00920 [Spirosomataceae bacterium]